jgi:hypothetical protein
MDRRVWGQFEAFSYDYLVFCNFGIVFFYVIWLINTNFQEVQRGGLSAREVIGLCINFSEHPYELIQKYCAFGNKDLSWCCSQCVSPINSYLHYCFFFLVFS